MEPGTLIQHYEVLDHIGAGGMGEVVRARDTRLGRLVAIKSVPAQVLDDDKALARFRQEARIVAGISHPNIAAVHGLEEVDGRPFLVMALVEGQTLADVLAEAAPPPDGALALAIQIATGMDAAHTAGAIHRDLKPSNVMVTPAGEARVIDFGLALPVDPASRSPQGLTTAGTVLGTAPYMSPEQVRGLEVDARTDIWSFGVLLLELLGGDNPFRQPTPADTVSAILRVEPDAHALPEPVRAVVAPVLHRCLAKAPDDRFDSMAAVVDALRTARERLAEQATTTSMPAAATADADDPTRPLDAVLRTLMVSDLVDSTKLVEALGDEASARIMKRHDGAARELLAQHGGREIDKTDGFLLLFDRPIQAVLYALDYHRVLRRLGQEEGITMAARVGIHLGEVILRANAPEAVALGAKPVEVEGLAKPTAARLMSAALPGQTLLTRGAYDLALRGAVGVDGTELLEWRAHGAYAFKGVAQPVDVFEVGVEGLSPLAPPTDTEKAHRVGSVSALSLSGPQAAPRRRVALVAVVVLGLAGAVAVAGALAITTVALGLVAVSMDNPLTATDPPDAAARITSILALPSRMQGSQDDDHLGDAVARSVSSSLSRLDGITVRLPPTRDQISAVEADPVRIAEAYRVKGLVTSDLMVDGDALVLDVQLVDALDQRLLWSHTYTGTRQRFLELTRAAAIGVAVAVSAATSEDEAAGAIPGAGGDEASTITLRMSRGMAAWNRYNNHHRPHDFDEARAAFESVLADQPDNTDALDNLGYLWMFRYEAEASPEARQEAEAQARRLAARSMAVRPTARGKALAHAAGGWRTMTAEQTLEDALEAVALDPTDQMAHFYLASMLAPTSSGLAAAAHLHTAEIAPLYLYAHLNAAYQLQLAGRAAEAHRALVTAEQLAPDHIATLTNQIQVLLELSRPEEAAERAPRLRQADIPPAQQALVAHVFTTLEIETLLAQGDEVAADAVIATLVHQEGRGYTTVTNLVRWGRVERAQEIVDALAASDWTASLEWLVAHPYTRPLAGTPEHQRLVDISSAGVDRMLAVLDRHRDAGTLPGHLLEPLEELHTLRASVE